MKIPLWKEWARMLIQTLVKCLHFHLFIKNRVKVWINTKEW
jgi:hypothetical protein